MKTKSLPLLLVVLTGLHVYAQDTLRKKFSFESSVPAASGTKYLTDPLGHLFTLNGTIFNKYDSKGQLLAQYSSKNGGEPSSADAGNPLRILLFYKSFQQIRFLDNTLSETTQPVDLQSLGLHRVNLACLSSQEGFWIYDEQNAELIRFNSALQATHRSGNIPQIVRHSIYPTFLLEHNDRLFLADSARGVLVFDNYGTYIKTVPITGIKRIQSVQDEFFYFKDGLLRSFHLITLRESILPLPGKDNLYALTEKEKLYLLKQNSIEIYKATP